MASQTRRFAAARRQNAWQYEKKIGVHNFFSIKTEAAED